MSHRHRIPKPFQFNFLGLVCAIGFLYFSLLPSLLPRSWVMQAVISGVGMAVGYGIGAQLSHLIRWFTESDAPRIIKVWAWRLLYVLAPLLVVWGLYQGEQWQNEVRLLVDAPPLQSRHMWQIGLGALTITITLIFMARIIRWLSGKSINAVDRVLPRRLSVLVALTLIVIATYWVVNGIFLTRLIAIANQAYARANHQPESGVIAPSSALRSGSRQSYIAWETLGKQGRRFVASGPSPQQISALTGKPAKDPVRIYAGIDSAASLQSRANLIIDELKRTKAFERKVLLVIVPTGTGWANPQAVDAVEYMYGGDTAEVALQYSYLPSWLSFFVNKQDATNAGQVLINAIYDEWAQLSEESRPKLVVFGLSLGSYGAQAAFSGVADLKNRTNGALFIGTPNDSQLWRNFTANRRTGSPERLPVVSDGKVVRFAANTTIEQASPWGKPRVLYLQHGSDPTVWWSPRLLHSKPDWLSETRAPDVSRHMQWFPIITFLHVTVDQFNGTSTKHGFGHNYGNHMAAAWQSVLQPPDWDPTKTIRLQQVLDAYPK